MKIIPYLTFLVLALSCSCSHKPEHADAAKAELIRIDVDVKEYYRRLTAHEEANSERFKNVNPFSATFDSDALAELYSEVPFPDPTIESIFISEEETAVLDLELERIVEENRLTLRSSNPFCGYLNSRFEYRKSDGDIYFIELMYCRPLLSIQFSSPKTKDEKDEYGDSYNLPNELIYSFLLSKCSDEVQDRVARIRE